jgi:hypothetical protein
MFNLGYIKEKLPFDRIFNFKFVKEVHPEAHHY